MSPSSVARTPSGRPLTDYPRPSIAVDTAVLTVPVDDGGSLSSAGALSSGSLSSGSLSSGSLQPSAPVADLRVLLVCRTVDDGHQWLLPGTFLHKGERLRDAVLRSLHDKAGIDGLSPRQLRVFDDPERDDRGWVVSVAHVDAVPWHRLADAARAGGDGPAVQMRPVAEAVGLPFDHDAIVAHAVDVLRADYREHPDPAALLPEPFTLRRLQQLHEAVLGERVAKDSFRRRMEPLLEPVGGLSTGSVGKPARLFARREG